MRIYQSDGRTSARAGTRATSTMANPRWAAYSRYWKCREPMFLQRVRVLHDKASKRYYLVTTHQN